MSQTSQGPNGTSTEAGSPPKPSNDRTPYGPGKGGKPVTGTSWGRFGSRLLKVLVRPAAFWRDLRDEQVAVGELLFPHVIVLIGVRAVAGSIGELLGGGGFGAALGQLFSSFLSWFGLVWVFALLAGSFASARGGRLSANDSMRLAAYGLAPLFVVGGLAAIPLPHVAPIAELIAMPYAFIVIGHGVVPCLAVKPENAPVLVGQLCGTLLVLWTVMPTLLPQLLRIVTG